MAEQELKLRHIVQRLPLSADTAQMSADLWQRIAAAHGARRRRRRTLRIAGIGMAAAALLVVVLSAPTWLGKPASAVDWQARAQALEIQLNALAARGDANGLVDAELVRIDAALQSAYDHGAPATEIVPLWKERSELLGALLTARQRQVSLTRI